MATAIQKEATMMRALKVGYRHHMRRVRRKHTCITLPCLLLSSRALSAATGCRWPVWRAAW